MSGILVVAEHLRGEVRDVSRELVTAAVELGGPVAVAVIAADPEPLAERLDLTGVAELVLVPGAPENFENDPYQAALEGLIRAREPEAVLLGFTVNSMGYAPAVAARLGLGFASDVFGLAREDGRLVATRAYYGGKVHAEVELPPGPAILLLRPTAWAPAEGHGSATRSTFDPPPAVSRARHVGFLEQEEPDVDIAAADFLLSIGRGVGERDNIAIFESLAGKLGATLSVSRPLVDAGWMPASRQVGQSGKTVKPKVYLAMGISGAVQHLAGMRAAGTIIAVNSDPEASIFGVAHFGAVADIFDVAEELEKLL